MAEINDLTQPKNELNEFNAEKFRVIFKAIFAVLGFAAAIAFLFTAVLSEAAAQSKYTGTILGFMTGTLITLVFTYYFGNSDTSPPPPPKIKNNIKI